MYMGVCAHVVGHCLSGRMVFIPAYWKTLKWKKTVRVQCIQRKIAGEHRFMIGEHCNMGFFFFLSFRTFCATPSKVFKLKMDNIISLNFNFKMITIEAMWNRVWRKQYNMCGNTLVLSWKQDIKIVCVFMR